MTLGDSSKYLLVKGCAGIGNRLFTIASAIEYAEKNNRKIIVDWRDGVFSFKGKNAFDLFFEISNFPSDSFDALELIETDQSIYPSITKELLNQNLYDLYCFYKTGFDKYFSFFNFFNGKLSRLNSFWYFNPGDNFGKEMSFDFSFFIDFFKKNHLELGHKLKNNLRHKFVLFADFLPSQVNLEYFRFISLKSSFVEKAEKVKFNLGVSKNTVGIHIRATDKQHGKSLQNLINVLKDRNNSEASYFLATDNIEVEELFVKSFGTNLVSHKKYYLSPNPSNNLHHVGLRTGDFSKVEDVFFDTLIDLYLLSKCGVLYYQGNSSFSKVASIWNHESKNHFDWLKL